MVKIFRTVLNVLFFQRRYILKFATDGAILTNTKNAVQGTIKVIPCDLNGKVAYDENLPAYLDKEIVVYYYIGKFHSIFISLESVI